MSEALVFVSAHVSVEILFAYLPRFASARLITWWQRGSRLGSMNAVAIGAERGHLLGRRPCSPRLQRQVDLARGQLLNHMLGYAPPEADGVG